MPKTKIKTKATGIMALTRRVTELEKRLNALVTPDIVPTQTFIEKVRKALGI